MATKEKKPKSDPMAKDLKDLQSKLKKMGDSAASRELKKAMIIHARALDAYIRKNSNVTPK